MHAILDPYVFYLPDAEHAAAIRYLESLVQWGEVLVNEDGSWSLLRGATNAMMDAGRFPGWDDLCDIVSLGHAGELYSVADLANLLRRISEVRPFVEERIGIDHAACEGAGVRPEEFESRLGSPIGEHMAEGLVLALAGQMYLECDVGELVFATTDTLGAKALHASVAMIMLSGARIAKSPKEFANLEGDFRIEGDAAKIRAPFVLAEVISTDLEKAVSWIRDRIIPAGVVAHLQASETKPGPRFAETLRQYQIGSHPALARRICERLALASCGMLKDVPGAKLHPVRESTAADAKQETRADGARLWRCAITQDGAGLRLQYWTLPEGTIEAQGIMVESDVLRY